MPRAVKSAYAELVTVRTLAEATQHRRLLRVRPHNTQPRRLVTGEGGAGLHTPPPGEGAATAAVWSQHGGVLTTYHRTT